MQNPNYRNLEEENTVEMQATTQPIPVGQPVSPYIPQHPQHQYPQQPQYPHPQHPHPHHMPPAHHAPPPVIIQAPPAPMTR